LPILSTAEKILDGGRKTGGRKVRDASIGERPKPNRPAVPETDESHEIENIV
jgi:hypothetical protein